MGSSRSPHNASCPWTCHLAAHHRRSATGKNQFALLRACYSSFWRSRGRSNPSYTLKCLPAHSCPLSPLPSSWWSRSWLFGTCCQWWSPKLYPWWSHRWSQSLFSICCSWTSLSPLSSDPQLECKDHIHSGIHRSLVFPSWSFIFVGLALQHFCWQNRPKLQIFLSLESATSYSQNFQSWVLRILLEDLFILVSESCLCFHLLIVFEQSQTDKWIRTRYWCISCIDYKGCYFFKINRTILNIFKYFFNHFLQKHSFFFWDFFLWTFSFWIYFLFS